MALVHPHRSIADIIADGDKDLRAAFVVEASIRQLIHTSRVTIAESRLLLVALRPEHSAEIGTRLG